MKIKMKTIVSSFFWVMISYISLLICLLLLVVNNYHLPLPYGIISVIILIIAGISFIRKYILMRINPDDYRKVQNILLKKTWFWICLLFIFIFLWNALFFLGQLFVDKSVIYTKVTLDGNYWDGCSVTFFFATFLSSFLIYFTYQKVLKTCRKYMR